MSQPGAARPTLLSSIDREKDSFKVRIAGRVVSYDADTGLAILTDAGQGVLLDVSLCIKPSRPNRWAREYLAVVTVIGDVEVTEESLPVPELPAHVSSLLLDTRVVIRIILITDSPDLDLRLWNESIRALK